ncbi:hypothetical protein PR048_027091 [Dryococelus australis]|uniref:Uncharacterized protein n=1 Tax=Dryococelus australis TaxID=614101 RepID=A0ABQ9GG53_9NEOP|nr:hypothetical protein PR048_027091 [Dryococelus australis]
MLNTPPRIALIGSRDPDVQISTLRSTTQVRPQVQAKYAYRLFTVKRALLKALRMTYLYYTLCITPPYSAHFIVESVYISSRAQGYFPTSTLSEGRVLNLACEILAVVPRPPAMWKLRARHGREVTSVGATRFRLSYIITLSPYRSGTITLASAILVGVATRVRCHDRLACSPPTKAIRAQNTRPVHSGFSHVGIVPDNSVGRTGFLGDLPSSPRFHSGAAPYSPQSPSSTLKASLLRASKIPHLTSTQLRKTTTAKPGTNPLFCAPVYVHRYVCPSGKIYSLHGTRKNGNEIPAGCNMIAWCDCDFHSTRRELFELPNETRLLNFMPTEFDLQLAGRTRRTEEAVGQVSNVLVAGENKNYSQGFAFTRTHVQLERVRKREHREAFGIMQLLNSALVESLQSIVLYLSTDVITHSDRAATEYSRNRKGSTPIKPTRQWQRLQHFQHASVPVRLPLRIEPFSLLWEAICATKELPGRVFPGISHLPPLLHSDTAPSSPYFILIGTQDLAVKSCPNLFIHSLDVKMWNYFPSIVTNFTWRMFLSASVKIHAGISRFPQPLIPVLLHTHLNHPHRLSTQISSLSHSKVDFKSAHLTLYGCRRKASGLTTTPGGFAGNTRTHAVRRLTRRVVRVPDVSSRVLYVALRGGTSPLSGRPGGGVRGRLTRGSIRGRMPRQLAAAPSQPLSITNTIQPLSARCAHGNQDSGLRQTRYSIPGSEREKKG